MTAIDDDRFSPSALRLAELLVRRIEDGTYRPFESLPKQAYLATSEGASQTTVSQAIQSLADRSMVHKAGRRWIVGSPRTSRLRFDSPEASSLSIVVLQGSADAWWNMRARQREGVFVASFSEEARIHGVRLVPALASTHSIRTVRLVHSGEDLSGAIRALGGGYLGAVAAGNPRSRPSFARAIDILGSNGRPVLWLEAGRGGSAGHVASAKAIRCGFAEGPFTTSALDYLHRHGHRETAFVGGFDGTGWQAERLGLLREHGARLLPPVKVLSHSDVAARLRDLGREGIASLLAGHGSGLSGRAGKAGDALLRAVRTSCTATPDDIAELVWGFVGGHGAPAGDRLGEALRILQFAMVESITAIIVSRDALARQALRHMVQAGLRIPGEFSVISYDNLFDETVLPVTTIDPGARSLGYRAFHYLLGDIAQSLDGERALIARPEVHSRGSVARLA